MHYLAAGPDRPNYVRHDFEGVRRYSVVAHSKVGSTFNGLKGGTEREHHRSGIATHSVSYTVPVTFNRHQLSRRSLRGENNVAVMDQPPTSFEQEDYSPVGADCSSTRLYLQNPTDKQFNPAPRLGKQQTFCDINRNQQKYQQNGISEKVTTLVRDAFPDNEVKNFLFEVSSKFHGTPKALSGPTLRNATLITSSTAKRIDGSSISSSKPSHPETSTGDNAACLTNVTLTSQSHASAVNPWKTLKEGRTFGDVNQRNRRAFSTTAGATESDWPFEPVPPFPKDWKKNLKREIFHQETRKSVSCNASNDGKVPNESAPGAPNETAPGALNGTVHCVPHSSEAPSEGIKQWHTQCAETTSHTAVTVTNSAMCSMASCSTKGSAGKDPVSDGTFSSQFSSLTSHDDGSPAANNSLIDLVDFFCTIALENSRGDNEGKRPQRRRGGNSHLKDNTSTDNNDRNNTSSREIYPFLDGLPALGNTRNTFGGGPVSSTTCTSETRGSPNKEERGTASLLASLFDNHSFTFAKNFSSLNNFRIENSNCSVPHSNNLASETSGQSPTCRCSATATCHGLGNFPVLSQEMPVEHPPIQILHDPEITSGPDAQGPDVRGPDVRELDVRGPDVRGSDVRGPDVRGSDVRGPDVRGSDVRGPDVRGPDVRGPDVRGPDVQGSNVPVLPNSSSRRPLTLRRPLSRREERVGGDSGSRRTCNVEKKTKKTTLPTVVFDAGKLKSLAADNCRCSICLEEFRHLDRRSFLPCLHSFHKQCIAQWLHRSSLCPICLLDVRKLLNIGRPNGDCGASSEDVKAEALCNLVSASTTVDLIKRLEELQHSNHITPPIRPRVPSVVLAQSEMPESEAETLNRSGTPTVSSVPSATIETPAFLENPSPAPSPAAPFAAHSVVPLSDVIRSADAASQPQDRLNNSTKSSDHAASSMSNIAAPHQDQRSYLAGIQLYDSSIHGHFSSTIPAMTLSDIGPESHPSAATATVTAEGNNEALSASGMVPTTETAIHVQAVDSVQSIESPNVPRSVETFSTGFTSTGSSRSNSFSSESLDYEAVNQPQVHPSFLLNQAHNNVTGNVFQGGSAVHTGSDMSHVSLKFFTSNPPLSSDYTRDMGVGSQAWGLVHRAGTGSQNMGTRFAKFGD